MTKMNYRLWAMENLSEQRARAFVVALSDVEAGKFSDEWKDVQNTMKDLVRAHESAVSPEVVAINDKAAPVIAALQDQIAQLQKQLNDLRDSVEQEVMTVRIAVYSSTEYRELDDRSRALWTRDDEAVDVKRQALVEKYAAAQSKVRV